MQSFSKDAAASLKFQGELIVLADVFVITPRNHVLLAEVKEKYPTRFNSFGLEEYRLNHYLRFQELTGIPVMYAIKDERDDGKWFWNNFDELVNNNPKKFPGPSWVDGKEQRVEIFYFEKVWFKEMLEDLTLNRIWRKYPIYRFRNELSDIKMLKGRERYRKIMRFLQEVAKEHRKITG